MKYQLEVCLPGEALCPPHRRRHSPSGDRPRPVVLPACLPAGFLPLRCLLEHNVSDTEPGTGLWALCTQELSFLVFTSHAAQLCVFDPNA